MRKPGSSSSRAISRRRVYSYAHSVAIGGPVQSKRPHRRLGPSAPLTAARTRNDLGERDASSAESVPLVAAVLLVKPFGLRQNQDVSDGKLLRMHCANCKAPRIFRL